MRRLPSRLGARFAKGLGAALVGVTILVGVPAVQAETTLRFVEGADIDSLDPAVQRSRPSQIIIEHVFEQLVHWKDTKLSGIVPGLAESWTLSSDKLKWTFKLRRGVTFHDGTPFNAEAVKFNLDRLVDPQLGSPNRSMYGSIAKVTVVDDSTVVIETKEPSPALLESLADSPASMNSPTAVRTFGRNYSRNPVGTGPYMLKEWIPGQHCVIVRNPKYQGPKPIPDAIEYRAVPEGGARVVELESGNADIVTGIPPEAVDRLKRNPRIRLQIVPSSFQVFFELNTTKPPFNDVRVRKALNYAVDRQAIVEKILGGFGEVPDGLFPKGVQGRVKLEPYRYDLGLAKKLIREVYPNGYKGKVVMWTPSGRYMKDRAVAETVQGYLNELGFETEFRVWEWASYQKTLYRAEPGNNGTGKGSNDANMWLLGTSIPHAEWRLRRKVSTGDPSNLTGYSNPKVDELLAKASVNMNYNERMAQYGEIQRIFWEEDPAWLFLFNQVQIIGLQGNVSGLDVYAHEVPVLDKVKK